jgi:hypothetical protein
VDTETFFLETLKDLRERSSRPGPEYEVQQLAALLRKLLLDERRLIDLVNPTPRTPIRFRVYEGSPYQELVLSMGPQLYAVQDAFDPKDIAVANARIAEVDVAGLLKRRILLIDGMWFSVADIVRYVAHVEGAVHRGQPKGEKEQLLAATKIHIGSVTGVVRTLLAVGRVVARGLEPLEDRIRARRKSGDPH